MRPDPKAVAEAEKYYSQDWSYTSTEKEPAFKHGKILAAEVRALRGELGQQFRPDEWLGFKGSISVAQGILNGEGANLAINRPTLSALVRVGSSRASDYKRAEKAEAALKAERERREKAEAEVEKWKGREAGVFKSLLSQAREEISELKEALSGRTVSCSNCNEMRKQLSEKPFQSRDLVKENERLEAKIARARKVIEACRDTHYCAINCQECAILTQWDQENKEGE